jgi:hypothetical protein
MTSLLRPLTHECNITDWLDATERLNKSVVVVYLGDAHVVEKWQAQALVDSPTLYLAALVAMSSSHFCYVVMATLNSMMA